MYDDLHTASAPVIGDAVSRGVAGGLFGCGDLEGPQAADERG